MYSDIKHFNGLNSLRFIAAFLVLIHHAEQIRLKYGMFNLKQISLFNNGGVAVSFFFVLSGFLITYLLILEKTSQDTIYVKKFYMRRILRIWPLYFLLIIIGTLIIPFFISLFDINYTMPYQFKNVILYYVFFSPFLVNLIFGNHFLEPLWSIGVEEIFYIFWAPIIKLFKVSILKICSIIIVVKFLILLFAINFIDNPLLVKLIKILSFESMSIGAIGAYYIFYLKDKISHQKLFSINMQIFLISLILFRFLGYHFILRNILLNEVHLFFINLFFNYLFLWLIINISLNSNSIIKLNQKWLIQLGDFSYGIYMYHMLVVFTVILLFKNIFNEMNNYLSSILFYTIIISFTILVSFFSKRYFEDYFLNLKNKFK